MNKTYFSSGKLKVLAVVCIVMLISTVLLSGCQAKKEEGAAFDPKNVQLVLITTPPGILLYNIAVGFSTVVEKHTGMMITPQPVTSSLSFPQHLKDKKGDLSIATTADVYNGFRGIEDYKDQDHTGLRLILAGDDLLMGLFTDKKSGILALEDIKGKDVTYKLLGAGTNNIFAEALMKVTGMDPTKDFKALTAEHTAPAWNDLVEGRSQVANTVISPALIEEAAVRIQPWMIPIEEGIAKKIMELAPILNYAKTKQDYSSIPAGTPTMATKFWMFTREELSEDVVYTFLKAAIDNFEEIHKSNPQFKYWDATKFADATAAVPYHPGAIKVYKEKGMWTDEMEKNNQALLAKIPEIQASLAK